VLGYKNRSRFIAGLLCVTLVFTTVFQPIRSKALVPALPAIPVIAMKAYEAIKLPAAIYGALKGIEQAGNTFESIFGSSVYEFWKENFTSEDDYNDFVSNLDTTSASSGMAVTGFSCTTLSSLSQKSPFQQGLRNLHLSSGDNLGSTIKHLGVNDKVLVVAMTQASPYDFLGVYFDESGTLCCGRFTNPFGAAHALYLGVYDLSSLNLIASEYVLLECSATLDLRTFYDKSYARAWDGFLTSDCFALDHSKAPYRNTSGILGGIEFYVFRKQSINVDFDSASRRSEFPTYGEDQTVYYFTSYTAKYSTVTWDNSRIVVGPSNTDSTSRLSSLMSILNEYNLKHTIAEGSDTVNYYLVPVGTDVTPESIAPPGLYDEETLVYTDPVTGTEYLTTGWTYDYNTRCYSLTMGDTFLIDDTVITRIDLTYGDDVLTVDHYDADGTLVQTDTYNYVAVSGSECGLNGHTYTYENVLDPTCIVPGERKYTCSVCGDEYAETVPAVGHTHVFSILKEATCTTSGIGLYSCSSCGSEYTEEIPAMEHTPEVLEVVPSEYDENGALVSVGYTKYECTVCGTQYTVIDTVDIEEEGWFDWLGGLFKTLLSSIVNGLASGLEWLINKVIVTVTSWIIKAAEWVFSLFDGESLTTLFGWFSADNAVWNEAFEGEMMFPTDATESALEEVAA